MQQNQQLTGTCKTTIFYDGSCPLCGREIAHYRRLRGSEKLSWVDIATDNDALLTYGLDRDLAMARFHVMDAKGAWQTGAYGFIEVWSQLPAYRWLAVIIKKCGLSGILDIAYNRFARWRIRRSCSENQCQPIKQPME